MSQEVLTREDLQLEEVCMECFRNLGDQYSTSYKTKEKCIPCNGLGHIPTEFGRKVFKFIQKRQAFL